MNVTTTSRYRSTTPLALEHVMRQFEAHQKKCHTADTMALDAPAKSSELNVLEVVRQ